MKKRIDYANNGNVRMEAGNHLKNKAKLRNMSFLIAACFALLAVFTSCEKDDKTFTVTFNSNGGSAVEAQIVKQGEKATKPANPTKGSYSFGGWFTDNDTFANEWNFAVSTITADVTLYAKWNTIVVAVTGVTLNQNELTLEVGETKTLTATVAPTDATNKDVTWTSSDVAVATVANGVIKAVTVGTATITVTTKDGGHTATCAVTIPGVTLEATELLLDVGETKTLTATVIPANSEVTWISSDDAVATVTNGVVTTVAVGIAKITVTTNDGKYKETCTVAVIPTGPKMTMTTKSNNVTIYVSGDSGTFNIYWGDGTAIETHTLLDGYESYGDNLVQKYAYTHNYSNTSSRTIVIIGENIEYLVCYNNQLTSLDLNANKALKVLNCAENQLTSLDVSKNIALTYLICSENLLTSLNVSNNTELTNLSCFTNKLTNIDVSKNTKLTHLNFSFNQLTGLDVSKNTALELLWCERNKLTNLDIGINTALTQLNCGSNPLESLDVSKNIALTYLICYDTPLKSLNVIKNTKLETLHCNNTQLTSLDMSNNTELKDLWCWNNKMNTVALNALFGTLHSNTITNYWGEVTKNIYIGGNPGTNGCDTSIATAKGWTVKDFF